MASSNNLCVTRFRFFQSRKVLLRNDQHMGGSLRIDVLEGIGVLVLADFFGRDFAANDFAKDAIFHIPTLTRLKHPDQYESSSVACQTSAQRQRLPRCPAIADEANAGALEDHRPEANAHCRYASERRIPGVVSPARVGCSRYCEHIPTFYRVPPPARTARQDARRRPAYDAVFLSCAQSSQAAHIREVQVRSQTKT